MPTPTTSPDVRGGEQTRRGSCRGSPREVGPASPGNLGDMRVLRLTLDLLKQRVRGDGAPRSVF